MIGPFRGEYRFLSNFYPSPFLLDGHEFPTVEHYYQAEKMISEEDFRRVVKAPTPQDAKRLARSLPMNPAFEADKRAIMLVAVTLKFGQNGDLRAQLVATGNESLAELNTWGDRYWGICGDGQNWLGRILMMVREVYR
jgi:N-glycosidase YbiA